ncbi:hypothetical protein [Oceanospirillum sp.]|uniref:hypothetical protein n=1 Tax=Oceanospirillum sp. TaxID=2021254 RepID=UPI003A8D80B1
MYLLNGSPWRRTTLLLTIFFMLWQASNALADTQQSLTVVKGETSSVLSLNKIESLGLHKVTMQHPEGPQGTFSGVWLDALLKSQELDKAQRVRFIAEDGYTTFLSSKERREKQYLLVTRLDGKPVTQKDLGPYMLIVPEDAQAALEGTASITRWIWAVRKIQVR